MSKPNQKSKQVMSQGQREPDQKQQKQQSPHEKSKQQSWSEYIVILCLSLATAAYALIQLGNPLNYAWVLKIDQDYTLSCFTISLLSLFIFFNFFYIPQQQPAKGKDQDLNNEGKDQKSKEPSYFSKVQATFIENCKNIVFEFDHIILFVILWILILYQDQIPTFAFKHDEEFLQKFQQNGAETYAKIFIILVETKIWLNLTFTQKSNNSGSILKLINMTCTMGLFIIETSIVEMLLTEKTLFRSYLLDFVES